jgi:hypothetical protein
MVLRISRGLRKALDELDCGEGYFCSIDVGIEI